MPVNRRQHFVSQFTIRQFAPPGKTLFCLDKRTLTVKDRTHGATSGDILNKAYYYTTDTDDFDGDVVKPLEKSVSRLCEQWIADPDKPLTLEDMSAMVDWSALSLSRSIYVAHIAPIAYDSLSDEDKADLPADQKAMTLVARRATFHRFRAELRKTGLMFRFMKAPRSHSYFLTDYPPIPIPYRRAGVIGPMLLPLAHNLMMVQVPRVLADDFFAGLKPTAEWLTLVQCGWAQRLIYSADLESLDLAAWVLSEGSGDHPKKMRERARLPFFGFGEASELASMWAEAAQPPPP